jgi:hypothetical protein
MRYPKKFYIVRLRADDQVICCGSKKECAQMLGISERSFLSYVTKCRNGIVKKYEIDVELEDED